MRSMGNIQLNILHRELDMSARNPGSLGVVNFETVSIEKIFETVGIST